MLFPYHNLVGIINKTLILRLQTQPWRSGLQNDALNFKHPFPGAQWTRPSLVQSSTIPVGISEPSLNFCWVVSNLKKEFIFIKINKTTAETLTRQSGLVSAFLLSNSFSGSALILSVHFLLFPPRFLLQMNFGAECILWNSFLLSRNLCCIYALHSPLQTCRYSIFFSKMASQSMGSTPTRHGSLGTA